MVQGVLADAGDTAVASLKGAWRICWTRKDDDRCLSYTHKVEIAIFGRHGTDLRGWDDTGLHVAAEELHFPSKFLGNVGQLMALSHRRSPRNFVRSPVNAC